MSMQRYNKKIKNKNSKFKNYMSGGRKSIFFNKNSCALAYSKKKL